MGKLLDLGIIASSKTGVIVQPTLTFSFIITDSGILDQLQVYKNNSLYASYTSEVSSVNIPTVVGDQFYFVTTCSPPDRQCFYRLYIDGNFSFGGSGVGTYTSPTLTTLAGKNYAIANEITF